MNYNNGYIDITEFPILIFVINISNFVTNISIF